MAASREDGRAIHARCRDRVGLGELVLRYAIIAHPMKSSISFARANDLKQPVPVLQRVLGGQAEVFSHWAYRHPKSQLWVIQDGGELGGSQGFIWAPIALNGEVQAAVKSESTYVDEALRGSTAFTGVYTAAANSIEAEGTEIIWGITYIGKVFANKLDFAVHRGCLCEANLLLRFQTELSTRWRGGFGLLSAVAQLRRQVKTALWLRRSSSDVCLNEALDSENLVQLFNQWPEAGSVHLHFDEEQVRYRITENPFVNYKLLVARRQGKVVGLLLYTDRADGARCLSHVRWFDDNALRSLLLTATRDALTHHKQKIITLANASHAPHLALLQALQRAGAAVYDTKLDFVLRNRQKQLPPFRQWAVDMLWTDGRNG